MPETNNNKTMKSYKDKHKEKAMKLLFGMGVWFAQITVRLTS